MLVQRGVRMSKTSTRRWVCQKSRLIAWPSCCFYRIHQHLWLLHISGHLNWWLAGCWTASFLFFRPCRCLAWLSIFKFYFKRNCWQNIFGGFYSGSANGDCSVDTSQASCPYYGHPDNFMHHGHWLVLPFRWANFDFYYLKAFLKAQTNMCCVIKDCLGISCRLYRSYSASIVSGYFAEFFFSGFFQRGWRWDLQAMSLCSCRITPLRFRQKRTNIKRQQCVWVMSGFWPPSWLRKTIIWFTTSIQTSPFIVI